MSKLRIAVVESPNAVDAFDGRTEAEALVAACKLMGHQAVLFFAKSRREFREVCQYWALPTHGTRRGIKWRPLFLHISCHGNDDRVAFGSDFEAWDELILDLEPVLSNSPYRGNFALSLSSCGSGSHNLDDHLTDRLQKKRAMRLPQYIFSIGTAEVAWDDALMGWSLLYHKLSSARLDDRGSVQFALKAVLRGVGLSFSYHRWNDESNAYRTYAPKTDD